MFFPKCHLNFTQSLSVILCTHAWFQEIGFPVISETCLARCLLWWWPMLTWTSAVKCKDIIATIKMMKGKKTMQTRTVCSSLPEQCCKQTLQGNLHYPWALISVYYSVSSPTGLPTYLMTQTRTVTWLCVIWSNGGKWGLLDETVREEKFGILGFKHVFQPKCLHLSSNV